MGLFSWLRVCRCVARGGRGGVLAAGSTTAGLTTTMMMVVVDVVRTRDGVNAVGVSHQAREACRPQEGPQVEVNGRAGDVVLAHPFMLHARSKNLGQKGVESVRFMCHPAVPLKQVRRG